MAAGLTRAGAYLDPTIFWSVRLWMYLDILPTGIEYQALWIWGDAGYTNAYIGVFADSNGAILDVYDGAAGAFDSVYTPMPIGEWVSGVLAYRPITTTLSLTINHTTVSVVVDLAALTFIDTVEHAGTDAGLDPNVVGGVNLSRIETWQDNTLLADTPLLSGSLADRTANARNWSTVGGAFVTHTPGPVLTGIYPEFPIVILSLPYVGTVSEADLTATPHGTGYRSSCAHANTAVNLQFRPRWYSYTPVAGEIYNAFSGSDDLSPGGNYGPRSNLWAGVLGTLAQVSSDLCTATGGDFYLIAPMTPGVRYLFQVEDNTTADPLSRLVVTMVASPTETVVGGDPLIPDDTDGFPAVVVDRITGELRRAVTFPAGELAATLPNGLICTQNGAGSPSTDVAIYTTATLPAITLVTTVDFAPAVVHLITSDKTRHFYICTITSGTDARIVKIDGDGTVVSTSAVLPVSPQGIAVARDGSMLYYYESGFGKVIRQYNLLTNTAEANLAPAIAGDFSSHGDGAVLADGSVVFAFDNNIAGDPRVRRISAAGAELTPFTFDPLVVGEFDHFAVGADDLTIVVWGQFNRTSVFQTIRTSDYAILATTPPVPTTTTSGTSALAGIPFAISNSCPLIPLPFRLSACPLNLDSTAASGTGCTAELPV